MKFDFWERFVCYEIFGLLFTEERVKEILKTLWVAKAYTLVISAMHCCFYSGSVFICWYNKMWTRVVVKQRWK